MSTFMSPSIVQDNILLLPSIVQDNSSMSTFMSPSIVQDNILLSTSIAQDNIQSFVQPKCDFINISYENGSLTDCMCPNDKQTVNMLNTKNMGFGTYDPNTKSCGLNQIKKLFLTSTGENETVCLDSNWNVTGGNVNKFWCSK